jgi:hypothetical protein
MGGEVQLGKVQWGRYVRRYLVTAGEGCELAIIEALSGGAAAHEYAQEHEGARWVTVRRLDEEGLPDGTLESYALDESELEEGMR